MKYWEIRDWFESLDFDKPFINFDGAVTNIVKNQNISIEKSTLFVEQNDGDEWFVPYYKSMQLVFDNCRGKYVTFLAEDHQFTIIGDVFSDYVDILKEYGEDTTVVHLFTQHGYKYHKNNNRLDEKFMENKQLGLFKPVDFKWTPYGLCSKKMYEDLGKMKVFDGAMLTEDEYTLRGRERGFIRFYPLTFIGPWMFNDKLKVLRSVIRESSAKDPNFILYSLISYKDMVEFSRKNNYPLSTDFYDKLNGFI